MAKKVAKKLTKAELKVEGMGKLITKRFLAEVEKGGGNEETATDFGRKLAKAIAARYM